jgi:hypothetical protein
MMIDQLSEEAYLQNINSPRRSRGDVDTTVYKADRNHEIVCAFGGFLGKTTGCLPSVLFPFSEPYTLPTYHPSQATKHQARQPTIMKHVFQAHQAKSSFPF